MTFRLLSVLVALAIVSSAVPGRAEDNNNQDGAAPGLAYASSFFPVPAGTPINVQPWDNTTDNQRVTSSFTKALNRRGVPLTDQRAKLILNFETEVDSLAAPGTGPTLGQAQGRSYDSRIRMNLWSNNQDSLLNGRQGSDDNTATTRYILRATLDDQQSGERLWQGEATYTGVVNDETAIFAAMAPILVDGFGQNLRPKTFRVQ
jgi:hypothetical protein